MVKPVVPPETSTLVTEPAPGPVKATVMAPLPLVMVTPEPAVSVAGVNVLPVELPISSCPSVKLVCPVPPLVTGSVPVTPVDSGNPVALVKTAADGVPRFGVTKVGDVLNTKLPAPVSSVTAAAKLAELGVAKKVATPLPSPLTPVLIGKPVVLVNVPDDGVPRAPPLTTNAPAVPVFTPNAVTTPVPVVVVLGAAPAPPPNTRALANNALDEAQALVLEK